MKEMKFWIVCSVWILMSTCSNSAFAELITFQYEGEEFNVLSDGTITGTLEFDASVSDLIFNDPEVAVYAGAASWTGQISGGALDGAEFTFTGGDIIVINDLNGTLDQLSVNFFNTGLQSSILFNGIDATVFENDALPNAFDLDDFSTAGLVIDSADLGKEGPSLTGFNFTSISTIPEPSLGIVACIYMLAMASKRRRH